MHTPAWICLMDLPHLGPVFQSVLLSGQAFVKSLKAFASNSSDKSCKVERRF